MFLWHPAMQHQQEKQPQEGGRKDRGKSKQDVSFEEKKKKEFKVRHVFLQDSNSE